MPEAGTIMRPGDEQQLLELINQAIAEGTAREPRGGGSKQAIGKPDRDAAIVDLSAFAGIVDYEPSELVLTLRPGTSLAEVTALLDENGQMLAFEPWDHGAMFGAQPGAATIGGIVAAGIAGPRRVSAGGVRDHLLGFSAVSGRGEAFKAGGKVVKNVTGYDLSKVMAGSWGELAIMTELSLKVVPKPRSASTIGFAGLTPEAAIAAMAKAMGSRSVPATAAYLPATGQDPSLTLFRLEGFAQSVDARALQLGELLGEHGPGEPIKPALSDGLWADIREARLLAGSDCLWRVQIAPSSAAPLVQALEAAGARWYGDWAGALIWVGASETLDVRALASEQGGHAMLLRAPAALRAAMPIRQPEAAGVAALSARVKQAFDPAGILSPSRFG